MTFWTPGPTTDNLLQLTQSENETAAVWGRFVFWRRGGDGRFATGHAAAPLRPSNRVLILHHTRPKTKRPREGAFSFSGGEGGIDSNRLRPILAPAGRASRVQNAGAFCRTGSSSLPLCWKTKRPRKGAFSFSGGEGGIRTPGTVLAYTHFPGGHLKPLSHLSEICPGVSLSRSSGAYRRTSLPAAAAHPGPHVVCASR